MKLWNVHAAVMTCCAGRCGGVELMHCGRFAGAPRVGGLSTSEVSNLSILWYSI